MTRDGRLCLKLTHRGSKSVANAEGQRETDIFFMPLGVVALASALTENGVDAEIINSDADDGNARAVMANDGA